MNFYSRQSNETGEFSEQGGDSGQSSDDVIPTKLIVNYLPQTLSDYEFQDIFSKCGKVISCKIIREPTTQYSYGYGFVEYSKSEEAARAIKELKGYPIQNKRLGVTYSRVHNREALKDTNLYVGNLPDSHCEERAIRELFSPFGKIITIRTLKDDRSSMVKGTAFVRFNKKDEAQEAIRNLNGQFIPGGKEALVVKVSEEHGKQRAYVYQGWPPGNQMQFQGGNYPPNAHRGGGPMRGGRGKSMGGRPAPWAVSPYSGGGGMGRGRGGTYY